MPMYIAGLLGRSPLAGSPNIMAHLFPDGVLPTHYYQLPQVAPVQGTKSGLDHVHADDQVLLV